LFVVLVVAQRLQLQPPQRPLQSVAPTQAPVTLSYLVSQGWAPDAEQALAKQFEEQTGIKIDYQIVPSDQYFSLLKTKLNSGEGPDLFGGQSGKTDLVVNYDVEKNAVDLSDQPWVQTEDSQVLDQSTVNGKVYGQTVWNTLGTTWVVNYNKDIFAQLNLSVPTTFAEFKSACEKIKATGTLPSMSQWLMDGIRSYGSLNWAFRSRTLHLEQPTS
jgi:raffinose/stachyose/melibiose transport system substrate-binding protein